MNTFLIIPFNFLAIHKGNYLMPIHLKGSWINPGLCMEARPSMHSVETIGAVKLEVSDWRSMTSLLKIYFCTILPISLKSFSQNGIKRLFKYMSGMDKCYWWAHYQFKSFNRIHCLSSCIHIYSINSSNSCHKFKHWSRTHTFDRKTYGSKIEWSW